MNWKNVTVKLKDLEPWDENPKGITKKRAKALLDYWDEIGQFQTIAIGPKNGNGLHPLYDGHQRLDVLKAAYGPDLDIDARESSRTLDGDERAKMTLMSIVGTTGFIDWDIVTAWDNPATQEWGLDADTLNQWNVDAGQLKTRLESEEENAIADTEPQIDKAEELRELWGVELGQMWQLGDHRLICGDCLDKAVVDRVMGGEVAYIEIHDPPYGMDLDTDYSKMPSTKEEGNKKYKKVDGDEKEFDPSHLLKSKTKEIFLWGADYYAERIPEKNNGAWLVWDKRVDENYDLMIGSAFELIWSRQKHKRQLIRYNNTVFAGAPERNNRLHPTQKPTTIYEWILSRYSSEGDISADFYLGAGSHLLACENLNRKCRAIEIDPGYIAVTLQRFYDHTGKTPVLIE